MGNRRPESIIVGLSPMRSRTLGELDQSPRCLGVDLVHQQKGAAMVMEKLELEPFVARDTPERLLRIVGVVTKTELHPRPGAMAERHPNPYTDLALSSSAICSTRARARRSCRC